jgi:capsular exopolysaccharide synthesis family protein
MSQAVQLWDYWFILGKRKFMIFATLIVVLSIVTLVNFLQKPIYSSYTDLFIEPTQPSRILASQFQQPIGYLDAVFFDTQAKLILSSYFKGLVVEEMINNPNELPEELKRASKESLRGMIRLLISLPSLQSARMLRITVEDFSPQMAALIANTTAKVYVKYLQQSQVEASRQSLVFLTQKLEDIRDKMNNSAYTLSDLDIQNQLEAASKVYGENHPIVIELKAKKEAIHRSLTSPENSIPQDKTTHVGNEPVPSDLGQVGKKDSVVVGRSFQINEEIYQTLLKKLQELNITGDVASYNVRIIEPARISSSPVRPNKRLNTIIGFIMGIVMGVGLSFFREYLDTTVKTAEDLKNNFHLTVLGLIPTIGQARKPKNIFTLFKERFFKKEKDEPSINKDEIKDELSFTVHRLGSAEQLKAPIAEAYRTLRTNLQFTQLARPLKSLLITSSIRGEGKTTTSVNLGIILAQTGKKILIVDTDLRRPRIHKAFNTGRDVGMTNLLIGESRLEDVVIPTDVKNLDILPSGPLPPNPAELVSSAKMKELIAYIDSKYDTVIFDSPPLVAVTDAALLATLVDGILLVVEAASVPRELLKQGLDRLLNVKANILGSILNNVNLQKGSYYYYYYHYYHYDYAYTDKT